MKKNVIPVTLNDAELEILRRRAKKANSTMQEQIRMAIMFEAVTAGDVPAIKLLGQKMRAEFVKVLDRFRTTGETSKAD